LVFSSFKAIASLVTTALQGSGIRCGIVNGEIPVKVRTNLLRQFNSGELTVLFFTFGCGSEGYNLQAANRILISCPWWNPQTENQAIARSFRHGQSQVVYVKRFVVVDSVDERIMRLHQQKKLLSAAVLNGVEAKLTEIDMKFLLGFGCE
jgi:DNA repair protein RAD5